MSMLRWTAVAVAAGAAFMPASGAGGALDDDLAVVKKATVAQAAEGPEADKGTSTPKAKAPSPQWLKVRVMEKAGKKARVSINVPLALVRALGDDCPLDWHLKGHSAEARKIRLSELLKALEAGQQIVEIDDDESTVKVWVE